RRRPLVTSALARTEVARALLPLGPTAVRRGLEALSRLDLIRVSDRILADAGTMMPEELRSLDAIHLATMQQLGAGLARVVTYDDRMSETAAAMGRSVVAPSRRCHMQRASDRCRTGTNRTKPEGARRGGRLAASVYAQRLTYQPGRPA